MSHFFVYQSFLGAFKASNLILNSKRLHSDINEKLLPSLWRSLLLKTCWRFGLLCFECPRWFFLVPNQIFIFVFSQIFQTPPSLVLQGSQALLEVQVRSCKLEVADCCVLWCAGAGPVLLRWCSAGFWVKRRYLSWSASLPVMMSPICASLILLSKPHRPDCMTRPDGRPTFKVGATDSIVLHKKVAAHYLGHLYRVFTIFIIKHHAMPKKLSNIIRRLCWETFSDGCYSRPHTFMNLWSVFPGLTEVNS